ncbi:unnamed protein product, partial [Owenia fusiformis]
MHLSSLIYIVFVAVTTWIQEAQAQALCITSNMVDELPSCNTASRYCCGCKTLFPDPNGGFILPFARIKKGECMDEPCISTGFCKAKIKREKEKAALDSAQSDPRMMGCTSNDDCPGILICLQGLGMCIAPGPHGSPCDRDDMCSSGVCDTEEEECVDCLDDSTCGENGRCDDDHQCVERARYGDVCEGDGQCESGLYCNTGACSNCQKDTCPSGQFCDGSSDVGFTCKPQQQKGGPCKFDTGCLVGHCNNNKCVDCIHNTDCAENKMCSDTYDCVGAIVIGGTCKEDGDCQPGLFCQSGVCSKCKDDGDCNM